MISGSSRFESDNNTFYYIEAMQLRHCKLRSAMVAYVVAARRRVHLVTVLLRPPSGHRPGRRQARHVHILQIGLRLAISQADARPDMSISFR